ncbi:permease [Leptospira langatensis]|uniref:Permease n=1 Tax=Leptospira langatensis TaxID=2484983 RepID=A0A5F1ZTD1_9LEPT|nr:AEC family transporter [Leptospira langatensis]TGK02935.1 permease [Leptospira langatensis]TGL41690.1 permease [Leptospira langatensis]
MSNFLVIGFCFLFGILIRWKGRFPKDSHKVINAFIISVSLPCMEFGPLRHASLDGRFISLAFMPWFLFGAGFLFFYLIGKSLGWKEGTIVCLCLSAGLGNTSFLGIPLIESYYSKEGLPTVLVIDQLGTFLTLAIPGTYLGTRARHLLHSEGKKTPLIHSLLRFPPFVALVISILSRPIELPVELESSVAKIGDTLIPLALFSVGYQLPGIFQVNSSSVDAENPKEEFKVPLFIGLVFKLLIGPMLVWLCFGAFFSVSKPEDAQAAKDLIRDFKILVMEAGMAPMITGSLLAAEWGLAPRLAVSLVGIGIPLSFLTTLGLYCLLENRAWTGTIFFGQ